MENRSVLTEILLICIAIALIVFIWQAGKKIISIPEKPKPTKTVIDFSHERAQINMTKVLKLFETKMTYVNLRDNAATQKEAIRYQDSVIKYSNLIGEIK